MISPFLTTEILLINLAVILITTSITGGIVTVVWLVVGRLLEKARFVNIVFELMKLASFFFCCPIAYFLLKVFEMEIGRGYLFSPTKTILICVRLFLVFWGVGVVIMLGYVTHDIRKLTRQYKDAFPCEVGVQAVFDRICGQFGLEKRGNKRRLQLKQSYHAVVPCMTGIFKPMVILEFFSFAG